MDARRDEAPRPGHPRADRRFPPAPSRFDGLRGLQASAGNKALSGLLGDLQASAGNKALSGVIGGLSVQRLETPEQFQARYRAAVTGGHWQEVATALLAFPDAGITSRVGLLNHDERIWLYQAALAHLSGADQNRVRNPITTADRDAAFQACVRSARWPEAGPVADGFTDAELRTKSDALTPEQRTRFLATLAAGPVRVRSALLDSDWRAHIAGSRWADAVATLVNFNDADIIIRLRDLSVDQILAVRTAAAGNSRLGPLIEIGSGPFTNTTDTGNSYTSNAQVLRNGILITKNVKFTSVGTFGSAGGFAALQERVLAAVTRYLTGKFKVRVGPPGTGATTADGDYPITVRVIHDTGSGYEVRLHGGAHGRSAVDPRGGDFYELGMAEDTVISDVVLAHESTHMVLGASDEYANASVPGRVISNDHSLMGNFRTQGMAAAEIKARHFQFLVTLVSRWFPGRTISIVR